MGFGVLNGISIGLLNLSLGFNSVGFYQVHSYLLNVALTSQNFLVISLQSCNYYLSGTTPVIHIREVVVHQHSLVCRSKNIFSLLCAIHSPCARNIFRLV